MTPVPGDPVPVARDPRRRLLDERAFSDRLGGRAGRLGPVVPPAHQDVDDDGAVAPGKGVAGELPPWRTTLDDPPPGWTPGRTAGPVRDRFAGLLKEHKRDRLWFPHLLIRSHAGDRGARPVWPSVPSWLSPDILLFPSAAVPPGDPVDLSRAVVSPTVGETYTVGVHIWNLGRFPAHGVQVKVWWVEPGFFSGVPDPRYNPHFIGGAWAELGDRESGHAHGIVLLPDTWTIRNTGLLHQCLLATVECVSDPWTGVLDANHDRHVGQRNVTLIGPGDDATSLLAMLHEKLDRGSRLTVGVAKAGRASLAGAAARHMASNAKEGSGWPVRAGKPRRLATVVDAGNGLVATLGKERHRVDTLGAALQLALGSDALTGTALMAGTVLSALGPAVVHLSTEASGYSLLIAPR